VAEFVAVTVYVPDAVTVGLAVVPPDAMPGPAQLKPVPDEVAAERTTDVVVQVRVPPVALAPGSVPLEVTSVVAVLVQPLAEFVTVTVYVPAAFTVGLAVVPAERTPGPAQLKLAPLVVVAERTVVLEAHVRVPPVALAPGGVVLQLIPAVAVLVHPLALFVTVTV
jgi:hypothetical protein